MRFDINIISINGRITVTLEDKEKPDKLTKKPFTIYRSSKMISVQDKKDPIKLGLSLALTEISKMLEYEVENDK